MEKLITSYKDCKLVMDDARDSNGRYTYKIRNNTNNTLQYLQSRENLSKMSSNSFFTTSIGKSFKEFVDKRNSKDVVQMSLWDEEEPDAHTTSIKEIPNTTKSGYSGNTFKFSSHSYNSNSYTPSYSKINLDDYKKSDTIVFHLNDRSTDMLKLIYEGRGWDVFTGSGLSPSDKAELINSHERVVCLGHGTSGGLCGGNITDREAPLLKNKKLFIIWCNADAFFRRNGIGDGFFITGNMPSEVWECRAAGCGTISAELMLNNITDWTRFLAEELDALLEGGDSARAACERVRDKYIKKYGDHRVTIYNAERTKVQGDPQPDLSSRYWGDDHEMIVERPSYSYWSNDYSNKSVSSSSPTSRGGKSEITAPTPKSSFDSHFPQYEYNNLITAGDLLEAHADLKKFYIEGEYGYNEGVFDEDQLKSYLKSLEVSEDVLKKISEMESDDIETIPGNKHMSSFNLRCEELLAEEDQTNCYWVEGNDYGIYYFNLNNNSVKELDQEDDPKIIKLIKHFN